ncbi:MAG: hypothetical protein JWL77_995 [Chthonomonadaceae bacterium]|nr:hypothetical protein [Chthonomonadaceae bacterium]
MDCRTRPQTRTQRLPRRGFTFIEVLVTGLIIVVCLMAMVSMWNFCTSLTGTSSVRGVAYSVGRQAIETVRETGFSYTPEGSTTLYYDGNGANPTASRVTADQYQAVTSVTSNKFGTNTAGVAVPGDRALRTVTVAVTYLPTGQVIYSTGSYLVKAGL